MSQIRFQNLNKLLGRLRKKNKGQEKEIASLKEQIQHNSFSIDRLRNNNSDFEFYTGFSNYSTFKAFYDYLSPACERLQYIGSSNNTNKAAVVHKCGPKRKLFPEEELFMCLTRLRLGLLEKDLANRFNLSVSQISIIWVTWLDFYIHG